MHFRNFGFVLIIGSEVDIQKWNQQGGFDFYASDFSELKIENLDNQSYFTLYPTDETAERLLKSFNDQQLEPRMSGLVPWSLSEDAKMRFNIALEVSQLQSYKMVNFIFKMFSICLYFVHKESSHQRTCNGER